MRKLMKLLHYVGLILFRGSMPGLLAMVAAVWRFQTGTDDVRSSRRSPGAASACVRPWAARCLSWKAICSEWPRLTEFDPNAQKRSHQSARLAMAAAPSSRMIRPVRMT